jgi:repressor LexA
MHGLTGRQSEVLATIRQHIDKKGFPPTLRELCVDTGIRSTNGVNDHLKALERKGYIARSDTKSRGIQLTALAHGEAPQPPESGVVKVDVYERLSGGVSPFLPENVVESVTVDVGMLKNARSPFGLRVRGSSMVDAGLMHGDTVFFSKQTVVLRGEIVCVVVGDEAAVRYIFPEKDYVRLQPACRDVPPLLVRDSDWHPRLVLGVARGMLRRIAYVA